MNEFPPKNTNCDLSLHEQKFYLYSTPILWQIDSVWHICEGTAGMNIQQQDNLEGIWTQPYLVAIGACQGPIVYA